MSADKPDDTRSHEPDFAALWSSDGLTRSLSPTGTALPADLPFLFAGGQRFGPYLIVRPLGKGGMGQVYEAEELDSGRRIALKLLSRGLGDDEERQRFLREGQLAASLSHPNVVYVFGTSEVQGFPVIAMELAPAGTLKDQMTPGSPMNAAQVVDAILQVIAGLQAAASIGILHRDIKPSNCFVDRDGRVMVGDFGLSIATLAREDGASSDTGTILGTPGFASPEQLHGQPLDVRSDIYSVGATIYYLLTGKAPFDSPDVRTMMTRMASEAAPALAASRSDLPGRLGAVVAKCLATKPVDRYASYAALTAALDPFRTASLTPASLGRRFLAGFVDSYTATLPLLPFNMFMSERLMSLENRGDAMLLALPSFVSMVAYYTIAEGRLGCGLGKAILNLRVVDAARAAPGFRRAFLRAMVFMTPAQVAVQIFALIAIRVFGTDGRVSNAMAASLMGLGSVLVSLVCLAGLFSTARRRNGYAAIHDRTSGTRVVVRPKATEARASRRVTASMPDTTGGSGRIGPYLVPQAAGAIGASTPEPTVVVGYDDRLRRQVWIEVLPAATPPVPSWRRDLGRAARVRWLSGRRAGAECWDAYEAFEGEPLRTAIAHPQAWARVRHWLADLAQEIAAGLKDGSLPPLRFDRIWITADDRARLLDWAPPSPVNSVRIPAQEDPSDTVGVKGVRPGLDNTSTQQFLYGVAAGALRGVDPDVAMAQAPLTPLPIAVRTLLLSLREGTAGSPETVEARTATLLREPARFSSRKRLTQLAVCSIIPFTMVLAVFVTIQTQIRAQTANPEAFQLKACLQRLVALEKKAANLTDDEREQRELIEIYVVEHLRAAAEDAAEYSRAFPGVAAIEREYAMAARALANHPQRSPERVKEAEAVVAKLLVSQASGLAAMGKPLALWGALGMIAGGAAAFVAVLGLIGAFAMRGGFTFRGFGSALVLADGRDASRTRALLRAVAAWSPLAIWVATLPFTPSMRQVTVGVALLYTVVIGLLLAGAGWAWRHPTRGIQDRIAGTWIVPR